MHLSRRAVRTHLVAFASFALAASVAVGVSPPAVAFTPEVKPQARSMAVSASYSLMIAADGRIFGAGKNDSGQLPGVAISATATTFTALDALPDDTTAVAVAAGLFHSVALGANGTVYTAGFNNAGQLALGGPHPGNRSTWGEVVGLPAGVTARSISAAGLDTYVLATDDKVYGAGYNESHQIDATSNSYIYSLQEIPLPAGNTAVSIAAGGPPSGFDGFLVLLGSSGHVFGRGSNSDGQLTGTLTTDKTAFTAFIGSGTDGAAVAAGGASSYILTTDGVAVSTGRNDAGQLGADTGTSSTSLLPMEYSSAAPGVRATSIAAGEKHVVVAGSDGFAYAAGQAGSGAIGNGQTLTNKTALSRMVPTAGLTLGSPVEVAAGASTSLIRDTAGVMVGAGAGGNGQLAGFNVNQASVVRPTGQLVLNYAVPVISGTAQVGQTLTATPGSWSVVPDQPFGYQWFSGSTPIDGATSSAYVLRGNDLGDAITVRVTASRAGFGPTASADSPAVTPVAGALSPVTAPVVTGVGAVGSTLSVSTAGEWSPAGVDSRAYQWLRNGTVIDAATGSSYVVQPGDVGAGLSVRESVTAVGYVDASEVSEAVTGTRASFGAVRAPTVVGTARVGATLTALPGGSSPAADSFSYEWLRDGVVVSMGVTRKLVSADAGHRIAVRVTAVRVGYFERQAASAARVIALFNVKRPTIKGTAKVGKTLKVRSKGSWAPLPTSYQYQWLRNGKSIKKATKPSYRVTAKDKGKRITVRVTARKPGVPGTSAISAKTSRIKSN